MQCQETVPGHRSPQWDICVSLVSGILFQHYIGMFRLPPIIVNQLTSKLLNFQPKLVWSAQSGANIPLSKSNMAYYQGVSVLPEDLENQMQSRSEILIEMQNPSLPADFLLLLALTSNLILFLLCLLGYFDGLVIIRKMASFFCCKCRRKSVVFFRTKVDEFQIIMCQHV